MDDGDVLVLSGNDVIDILAGREAELLGVVADAYACHLKGQTALPHSTFLHIAGEPPGRIIALPAYLGDGFDVAGIKWIGSFPANHRLGLDRASAVVVLNSSATGRPLALMEGATISAKRTAASAALAARWLVRGRDVARVGLIGCGVINREIARFLRTTLASIATFAVYDRQPDRSIRFRDAVSAELGVAVEVADDPRAVLETCRLICFATTAATPHVYGTGWWLAGTTILHVSLRDLGPEVILAGDNVVDDPSHVCREGTSLALTEQAVGHRDFIRCTLGHVLADGATLDGLTRELTIFSPFGLGILDVAVGKLVFDVAHRNRIGIRIPGFLPRAWTRGAAEPRRAAADDVRPAASSPPP